MRFLLIFVSFLSLFTLEAKSEQDPFQNPPQFYTGEIEQDFSFEVEEIRQNVMEPCRDQYIDNNELSPEERSHDMMDCLILRSSDQLNVSSQDFSLPERLKRKRELPSRFGLRPPTREELLDSLGYSPYNQLQIQLYANDDGYSGRIEFDTVIPLHKKSADKALFVQPGFILSIRNNKGEINNQSDDNFFIASAGLVYRFVFRDGILGFNLFYDHHNSLKNRAKHNRLSAGADYQSGRHRWHFNYYYPLEDWLDVDDIYEEQTVESAEFYWTYLWNEQWESSLGISVSDYKSTEDQIDLILGLDYKLDCGRSLSLGLEHNLATHKNRATLTYNIILGLPDSYKGVDCLYKLYESSAKGLLYRPVERKKEFRFERRKKVLVPQFMDSDNLHLPSGDDPSTREPSANDPSDRDSPQDSLAPYLYAQDQVVIRGHSLSYSPIISNVEPEEHFVVNVDPVFTYGSPVVTYSQRNNQFNINATEAELGEYSFTGHIQDEEGYFSYWSFKVTVISLATAEDLGIEIPSPDRPGPGVREGDENEEENERDEEDRENEGDEGDRENEGDENQGDENEADENEGSEDEEEDLAPILSTSKQSVRKGSSLSYQPHISHLEPGELFTVTVSTEAKATAPAIRWDSTDNSFLIDASSSSVLIKDHSFIGTIQDENGNANSWSLIVSVTQEPIVIPPPPPAPEIRVLNRVVPAPDEEPPRLSAENQVVEIGTSLNYSPTIGDLRENEGYTVSINAPESNAPTVTWDQTNSRFTIDAGSAQLGTYTISGTIEDESNNARMWSFTVQVRDTQAPSLTATSQSVSRGRNHTYSPTIGNLRSGESYTVTVTASASGAPTVTWDQTNSRFAINASVATIGSYSISGTIQDGSSNSSTWSFTLNVTASQLPRTQDRSVDTQAPSLTAQNQVMEIGTSITHSPTIGNLRENEGYTVSINALASGAPTVTWDQSNSRFTINASSAQLGTYTISGTVQDQTSNSSTWSFTVRVRDTQAPSLSATSQSVKRGESLSFSPTIGNLRSGESYTVTITAPATGAPTVTWSQANNQITINASSATVGTYSISGTIRDASNNSSTWSFTVNVTASQTSTGDRIVVDSQQAPSLSSSNRVVEIGESIIFGPTIGNLGVGESYTVSINTLASHAPTVTWNQSTEKFTISAISGSARVGQYRISGTIQDSSNNSSNWSFQVTVRDSQAPSLTAQNQVLEIGRSLSFSPTIGNVRSGESYTVSINALANNAPTVTWSQSTRKFTINTSSAQLGSYTISGAIRDSHNNSSLWSFRINVRDTRGPSLTAPNLTMERGKSLSFSPTIGNLRTGESFTVTIDASFSHGPTVTWNPNTKKFTLTASQTAAIKTHLVSGTIRDASNNSNNWSFRVVLRERIVDRIAPTLTAQDQSTTQETVINFSPTIRNLRTGESYTVSINTISPSNGAPTVTWNQANSRFTIDARGATSDQYTVSGTITDDHNNSSTWSFKVIVDVTN